MTERLDQHTLDNGLVILGEPMEAVESAAFDYMLPAGAAMLPDGCCGAANIISDWVFRGAGNYDSRALGDALDGLGLHRAGSVSSSHVHLGAALEASNLSAAIDLYGQVVLRPRLEAEQFALARQLAIDGILALEDEPRRKVMLTLRSKFYPSPLGRSTMGEIAEIEALDSAGVGSLVGSFFCPSATVFSLAGKYDLDAVCRQLAEVFADAEPGAVSPPQIGSAGGAYTHIHNDGAQVHIGLMTEAPRVTDEDYYDARVAISILSGGMSARLFTEVREKRGLCYAIGARYHGLKDAAGATCYAGTTPDKAQETLDVVTDQFRRLDEGISAEELDRAKVGLKASLVMQSESSSSRAAAIGSDYYLLGRVRSLDEIKEKIDATSVDSVVGFLRRRPFERFTVVTIGPREVTVQ